MDVNVVYLIAGIILIILFTFLFFGLIWWLSQQECRPICPLPSTPGRSDLFIVMAFGTLWLLIIGFFIALAYGAIEPCSLWILFWISLIFLIFLR